MNPPEPKPVFDSPRPKETAIGVIKPKLAPQKRWRAFIILASLLTLAFAQPLWSLVRLALETSIQSHVLLIPFIFLYLWKTTKRPHSTPPLQSSLLPALIAGLCGFIALAAYWSWGKTGRLVHGDALSLATFSFLTLVLAAAFATLGRPALWPYHFAITFLVFMIPLPGVAIEFMSIALQKASAEVADVMLSLTGMPVFREGLVFQFPGLSVFVAEECSGVRSTFVLFITSLLAGHLFLRTGWKKLVLALAIFPLGILRNGFRITTISWLTVNVDSGIIDSPLHHQGGPIFFVLSLVPLFGLLWLLRRSDFPRRE